MQGILEYFDGSIQRRLRPLESRHEILERNRGSPIGDNGVKVEDAVEFVHEYPSSGLAVRTSMCSLDDGGPEA